MIKLKNLVNEGQRFESILGRFDVDTALAIIKKKGLKPQMVDITQYAEKTLGLDRKRPEHKPQSFMAYIDYEYLKGIPEDRLKEAGIIATVKTPDKKSWSIVMDGNHRLAKNYMNGQDKMLMYILDAKNTKAVMLEMMLEMDYPLAKKGEQQSYEGHAGWKGKIVWMTPDKFLSLCHPLPAGEKNDLSAQNLRKRMKEKLPIDFLVLKVDSKQKKVIGHEGRHRATVAKELGIEKVPVLVYFEEAYPRVPKWGPEHHEFADKAEFKPEWDKT
jgi:hypothetical protein